MKLKTRWCAVVLSILLVLSLAAPALAASSRNGAVLNVYYAPPSGKPGAGINSTEKKPIIYTAYRVADITTDEGVSTYTLTPPFTASGVNINDIMVGQSLVDVNATKYKTLRSTLGRYINAHSADIKSADGGSETYVIERETKTWAVGTTNEEWNGVARFEDLADGLYLITSNASAWIGGTQYTPIPFLLSIPYELDGVSNNYMTAYVKFTSWTPSSPTPTPTPTPDDDLTDIPDESPPLEGPDIDILPDDVPLVDGPDIPDDDLFPIIDEDVPLASLPQTGQLWWPVPLMAAAGLVLMLGGILVKKRAARDA